MSFSPGVECFGSVERGNPPPTVPAMEEVCLMNPLVPIVGAVILAALLITFAVPGGVFVVPVLILAALCFAGYRYVEGRRAGSDELAERGGRESGMPEEPIQ
jgi:membrane protein DedA with SNARE-associated domain